MKHSSFSSPPRLPSDREAHLGLAIAARLHAGAEALPADIGERLRFAREQALARARQARTREARPAHQPLPVGDAALTLAGPGGTPWWLKLAALLPLLLLVVGLMLIEESDRQEQIRTAAEIDAALLADDLPPSAYSDPGFGEFLRRPPSD